MVSFLFVFVVSLLLGSLLFHLSIFSCHILYLDMLVLICPSFAWKMSHTDSPLLGFTLFPPSVWGAPNGMNRFRHFVWLWPHAEKQPDVQRTHDQSNAILW